MTEQFLNEGRIFMTRKVKVAIFDNDLRVEIRKCDISDKGNKIRIASGGTSNWKPSFDNDSFLEFPRGKLEIWKPKWTRYYIVKKKGAKCVNFSEKSPTIPGPDPEALKLSNLNLLATKIGKDTNQGIPWYIWAILITSGLSFLLLLQMSGVLR